MPLRRLTEVLRHPVSQNALSMYGAQAVLAFVPLITLPWLARALGPSELGLVIFVQALSFVLGNVVDYGFMLSATRDIARAREDPSAMARIVAEVQGAKLVLLGFTTLLLLLALVLVPEFRSDPRLALLGWLMTLFHGFIPAWFLVGLERVRTVAAVEVTVRLLTALAIILVVRERGDGQLVLWIWVASGVLVVGILSFFMYRTVPFRLPTAAGTRAALQRGRPLFVATSSITLYTSATVFLLGLVATSAEVAVFATAERVIRAALRAVGPIGAATYPRVNFLLESGRPERAQRLAALVFAAQTGLALVGAALLIILAPVLVEILFGPGFERSVSVLRTLALLMPCVAAATSLSGQWLLPHGLDRKATRIAVVAAVTNIVLTLVVGSAAGATGVAWVAVGIEAAIALATAGVTARSGLLRRPAPSAPGP